MANHTRRGIKIDLADLESAFQTSFLEMCYFLDSETGEEHFQTQLWKPIDGRGAFRRFKDVMFEHHEERQRWLAYRDARLRQRVLDWLADEGIEPSME